MRTLAIFAAIGMSLSLGVSSLPAAEADADNQLIMACLFGDPDRVKKALDAGANVNTTGAEDTTAIMWASERGFPEIVRTLLDRRADVNAQTQVDLQRSCWQREATEWKWQNCCWQLMPTRH